MFLTHSLLSVTDTSFFLLLENKEHLDIVLFCLLFCWCCILSATLRRPWGFGFPTLFVSPTTFSRVHREQRGYPKLHTLLTLWSHDSRTKQKSWLVRMSTWFHSGWPAVPSSTQKCAVRVCVAFPAVCQCDGFNLCVCVLCICWFALLWDVIAHWFLWWPWSSVGSRALHLKLIFYINDTREEVHANTQQSW